MRASATLSAGLLAFLAAGLVQAGEVALPLAVGGAYVVPTVSIKEARYSSTIRQQFDFSCGSAALSTLLTHHYRFPVTEQKVFEEMIVRGDRAKIQQEGFSLLDMKRYLEAHGFEADGFEVPLNKLASASIPAIALINENGYNHFVVIKGVREGRVLIGDPAGGTKAMTVPHFEKLWLNQILFVITNKQEIARFNLETDWRVAPKSPLFTGVGRDGLSGVVIPKHGPGDF